MDKKTKKIIAIMAAVLMLVMTFAEVPAAFAEESGSNLLGSGYENEENENDGSEQDLDTDGNGDTPSVIVDEDQEGDVELFEESVDPEEEKTDGEEPEEVAPEGENPPEGEGGEPEPEPEPWDPSKVETDPIEIEGQKLFPRLYVNVQEPYWFKRTSKNIKIKLSVRWTLDFDGGADLSPAEKEYKALTEKWNFKYTIKKFEVGKVETTTVIDNLTYDRLISGAKNPVYLKVEPAPVKYYMEVTATSKADPSVSFRGSSLGRTVCYAFPPKPVNLKAKVNKKTNAVTLTWKSNSEWKDVDREEEFCVYRSTNGKLPAKPIVRIEKEKNDTWSFVDDSGLDKGTYTYYVRAIHRFSTGGEWIRIIGDKTAKIKVKIKKRSKYLSCHIRPIGWKATLRRTGVLYANRGCSKKKGTLKKGTKVKVVGKYPKRIPLGAHPTRYQVQVLKGKKVVKKGWVKYGPITHVRADVSYLGGKAYDWTTKYKEYYVNKRKFKSNTKYLIWLSTYTQRVNIFKKSGKKWKLVRSSRCTSGRFDQPTGLGYNFRIFRHQQTRYRTPIGGGTQYYYKYLSYFTKGNSFHTICWGAKSHRPVNHVKSNLQPGTKGCIRMPTADAIWIWDNIPMKTKVVVH